LYLQSVLSLASGKKHAAKENNHPSYCTAFSEDRDNAVDTIPTPNTHNGQRQGTNFVSLCQTIPTNL